MTLNLRTVLLIIFLVGFVALPSKAQISGWKSGVATRVITPDNNIWMGGYAHRERPADGALHDLKIKALALQDPSGSLAVMVTSDLLGLPKHLSDDIASNLISRFDLDRSRIMLTSSHTHSGPVLDQSLATIYPLTAEQQDAIKVYTQWLKNEMITVASMAIDGLQPSTLKSGSGQVRFAVNRRNNSEKEVTSLSEFQGPVDHSVPVLTTILPDGSTQAIVFGYACHATTLSGYDWSGDYPGFAQEDLENEFAGSVALFFSGCGADQNPLPRRSVPLARQYGHQLAATVSRVLEEEMTSVEPVLTTSYKELELPLSAAPSKAELIRLSDSDVRYQRQWAKKWLGVLDTQGAITTTSYPWYPIQVWQLGTLSWIALGGEVVVGYSNKLKALLGHETMVTAYANDVMAYIPTKKVLKEGGYEGATSMQVYGLPSPWAPSVEDLILTEVKSQVDKLRSNSLDR